LLPNIRYGTERYPPKVARRLRALNITTWCAATLGALFAFSYFIDSTPGVWKVGVTNVFGSLALAMIPFLHRVGPRTAPAAFAAIIYIYIFIVCWQVGTGTGMQMQYLAVAAATILFLGTESIGLIAVLAVAAVVLIVALEIMVPRETGLVPSATIFGGFLLGVPATCAILFGVVYYAVREAARAEASAEMNLRARSPPEEYPARVDCGRVKAIEPRNNRATLRRSKRSVCRHGRVHSTVSYRHSRGSGEVS
jgi:adenylate cyclase